MTAQAATPPADTKRQANVEQGTEYVVLSTDESGLWKNMGRIVARDSEAAVLKFAADKGQTGTFQAIPSKRKPLTVKSETVTTLKLEEAK